MAGKEAFILDLEDDENVVQYELVPDEPGLSPEGLEACRRDCLDVAAALVQDYIWQRDAFSLHASTHSRASWRPAAPSSTGLLGAPPASTAYLWGSARFGDNVDDAWFISWLLRELTKRFPALSARVWDNDGEFLLIEAAHALPRWVQPDTAGNRVWLRAGALNLIPLPSEAHPGLPSLPSLAQAHALVTGSEVDTRASTKVQAALEARWGAYPARARANTHRARCIMPRRVAGLLGREPGLVAAAVDAFVHRGPDDMRAAVAMAHFPPEDLVSVTVRFSRCLYAQTALQVFEAPRGFPMPPAASKTDPAARLGMKLTCGFEMLYAQHLRTQAPGEERPDASRQPGEGVATAGAGPPAMPWGAAEANAAVRAYLNSLQQRGYFQGNVPGSAAHTRLREAALGSFAASEQYERAATALAAPARRINELLATPLSPELLDQMQGPEDSNAWMSSGGEELDAELAAREREQAKGGRSSGRPGFDPEDMVVRMKAFVEAQAGYEGAEVPSAPGLQRAGVDFSNAAFLRQLGGALGLDRRSSGSISGSSEEGSSFFSRSGSGASDSDASAGPAPPPAAGLPGRAADRSAADPSAASKSRAERSVGPAPDLPKGVRPTALDACAERPGPRHGRGPQGVVSQPPDAESAASEAWEVCTATDSDEAGFEGAYDAVLAEQLGGTSLAQTFREAQNMAVASTAAEPGRAVGSGGGDGQHPAAAGAGLQPVHVDLNLVQSLLASYAGQQGLPGPASNLAGLMGLRLPDNADD